VVEIDPKPLGTTAFGGSIAGDTKGHTIWMNYLSIGVDAKVVHDFEWCRTNCKSAFCCQLINKAFYGLWGALNCCYCTNVTDIVQAEYDTGEGFKPLSMPKGLESLVTLNISSFGAGIDVWGTGADGGGLTKPSVEDGSVEVVGIGGSPQLGCAKSGCRDCVDFPRIAQAKALKYTFTKPLHMQLDGEAWLQPASEAHCIIYVRYVDQ